MIRIGTRSSPLALRQAQEVKNLLKDQEVEILPIVTQGDRMRHHLWATTDKGMFIKEIQEALLRQEVDIGVHALKDVPLASIEGLEIGGVLRRKNPRDVWFSRSGESPATMASGTVVGTASLRRQVQILALRPDFHVVPLRGNVETRLRKLDSGKVDAIILAAAGIERLSLARKPDWVFDSYEFVPAIGQGVLGLEIRSGDSKTAATIQRLTCPETLTCVITERGFLLALEGSCRMPIGGLATLEKKTVHFHGVVAAERRLLRIERSGPSDQAYAIGYQAGLALKETLERVEE